MGYSNDENSVYSRTDNKDLHIEGGPGHYYVADSAGRPVGPMGGYVSADRSFVEGKMRERANL